MTAQVASTPLLVREVRRKLGLHFDRDFAKFLKVSTRTVTRHAHRGGVPIGNGFGMLIRAVYPLDAALAQALATSTGVTLEQAGVGLPVVQLPAVAAAPQLPPARPEHATVIVCAAADALRMVPSDVRPVLATIFAEARALGVDLHSLSDLLIGKAGKPKSEKQA